MQMKFYSPLTADFFPNDTEDLDDDYSEYEGIPYTGKELTGYRDVIRDAIYEDVKDFYGDLMRYYREDDSVRRKVVRAVPTVDEVNGELVGSLWVDTDAPLTVGETVTGEIDWERRFRNMQGHSGEHLVSGLIHAKYGYDNVGFHMGSEEITIDLNGTLTWDELLEIEKKANRMIWENLEIYAGFPSQEELAKMDYRSKKELTGDIRIVSIPNGDTCACCGTHVAKTGEIGLVKFLIMIHYKGGVRISLLCGEEAVMDYEKKREELQKISVFLSAKAGKTADAVEKLKNELMQTQAKLSETSRKLMKFQADQLKEGNEKICYLGNALDMTELRHFVNFALEGKKGEIVLALSESVNGGFSYVLGSQSEDMRALSKELNGELSGRGGGSSQMAQGTFFAKKEELLSNLAGKGFVMA